MGCLAVVINHLGYRVQRCHDVIAEGQRSERTSELPIPFPIQGSISLEVTRCLYPPPPATDYLARNVLSGSNLLSWEVAIHRD
ncbi:hypothetical protein D3C80_1603650 [compost metagenome]